MGISIFLRPLRDFLFLLLFPLRIDLPYVSTDLGYDFWLPTKINRAFPLTLAQWSRPRALGGGQWVRIPLLSCFFFSSPGTPQVRTLPRPTSKFGKKKGILPLGSTLLSVESGYLPEK